VKCGNHSNPLAKKALASRSRKGIGADMVQQARPVGEKCEEKRKLQNAIFRENRNTLKITIINFMSAFFMK
jgi:hypothetical protein